MTALRQRFLQDLRLAEHCRQSPDSLSEAQVRDYLSHRKNQRHFAPGSLTIATSGIKFFFRPTAPRDWKTLEHLRVPPETKLPEILTVAQSRRFIAACRSDQSRTCLWTIYSVGLRLSESLSLQIGDIDAARSFVHVHRGKGSVDR